MIVGDASDSIVEYLDRVGITKKMYLILFLAVKRLTAKPTFAHA